MTSCPSLAPFFNVTYVKSDRIQLCEGRQAQMRREIKQFQRPAAAHNPRATEDQGAQSVIVNLLQIPDVEDDIHNPCFRKRDYRSTQGRFRVAYY